MWLSSFTDKQLLDISNYDNFLVTVTVNLQTLETDSSR